MKVRDLSLFLRRIAWLNAYALQSKKWRWKNDDLLPLNVSNEIIQSSFFFEMRLLRYFIVLKISGHKLTEKLIAIRTIRVLKINISSICSIMSFWVEMYRIVRSMIMFLNFMKSSYLLFKIFSSSIRKNFIVALNLIVVISRNSLIVDKTLFFRRWI